MFCCCSKPASSSLIPDLFLPSAFVISSLWIKTFNGIFIMHFHWCSGEGRGGWYKIKTVRQDRIALVQTGSCCLSCAVTRWSTALGFISIPFLTPLLTLHALNTEFNLRLQTATSFSTWHAPPTHRPHPTPHAAPAFAATWLNPGDRTDGYLKLKNINHSQSGSCRGVSQDLLWRGWLHLQIKLPS